MATDAAIGIDLGGTNMRAAVIERGEGRALALASQPTLAQEGPERGVRRIGDLIERVMDEGGCPAAALAGIGIGATGPLDVKHGLMTSPWNMPGWNEVPIVRLLSERFGLPTWLDNDCNAAALGEHWLGAGRGCEDMIFITVSTGIGAGIILGNRLHRGHNANAGEVGLMTIAPGGALLEDLDGAWEALASGPAIARMGREANDDGLLAAANGDPAKINAPLIAQMALEGNRTAQRIVDEVAYTLGVGIANLLAILAPQIVVMGGGVMESWDVLQPRLDQVVRARTRLLPGLDEIPIVRAELGDHAGIFGAARLVFLAESARV